jgi:N-methylhydantoinase A/oxoprolinase/acetone carboxylase beta subunit
MNKPKYQLKEFLELIWVKFLFSQGTTIATNALLERKGSKNCMILTKGFKDLLTMRNLARPNIFDLKC